MAGCDLCGIQGESPCAIICLTDCSVCWVSVASAATTLPVAVARVGLKNGAKSELKGSTSVHFCCTDLSAAQVASFLNQVHPGARIRTSDADQKPITRTFNGTLDALAKEFGSAY